jgi:hypothetical protein
MHDPLDPREETRAPQAEPRAERRAEPQPQSVDRELPASELPDAVHAWLDGDGVSENSLAGAERELRLWKKISAETGRRRRMTTPPHVPAQILAKLSDD